MAAPKPFTRGQTVYAVVDYDDDGLSTVVEVKYVSREGGTVTVEMQTDSEPPDDVCYCAFHAGRVFRRKSDAFDLALRLSAATAKKAMKHTVDLLKVALAALQHETEE